VNLAVGLRKRRSTRSEVVEHKSTLIHFRKKAGAHEMLRQNSGDDEKYSGREHTAGVVEDPLQRTLITK